MENIRRHGWDILLGIIAIILVVVLWSFGFKELGILTMILGFALWVFEKRIEQQNQIILQASQAGFDFKQHVTNEMYEAAKDLWKQSIWLARNFSAVWPGSDTDELRRKKYLNRMELFEIAQLEHSILLPKEIHLAAVDLSSAINKYRAGRDVKQIGGEANDPEILREGGQLMKEGVKALTAAFNKLPIAIRNVFGLGKLPGEIIQPQVPQPAANNS